MSYIEKLFNLKDKVIFTEKPLFDHFQAMEIKNNKVFVGYVLRFHPLIQKIKEIIKNEDIYFVEVNCNSYLPNWRNNIDYKDSYSSHKNRGGGVLLDLSHELDYIMWLFGELKVDHSFQSKISELEIDSDDINIINGKLVNDIKINITLGYFSKISRRDIFIHSKNKTIKIDLINNNVETVDISGSKEQYEIDNLERNFMFKAMHNDILNDKEFACTFEEGMETMKVINTIQEQNV